MTDNTDTAVVEYESFLAPSLMPEKAKYDWKVAFEEAGVSFVSWIQRFAGYETSLMLEKAK